MMDKFPVLRVELSGVAESIQCALALHHTEIEEYINKYVDEAVLEYQFKEQIKYQARTAIDTAIVKYFKDGKGQEQIDKMTNDAISSLFEKDE